MNSAALRTVTRIVAPAVLAALLVLLAWQGGSRSAESRISADGSGINVLGEWTIDVYGSEGELVEQRTFTNELTDQGRKVIAELLSGVQWEGVWPGSMSLNGPTPWMIGFPCDDDARDLDGGRSGLCFMTGRPFESTGEYADSVEVKLLEAEGCGFPFSEPMTCSRGFVLQGSAVLREDITLDRVVTAVEVVDLFPEIGPESVRYEFTSKSLPPEEHIEVIEGQSLVIRVEISFS